MEFSFYTQIKKTEFLAKCIHIICRKNDSGDGYRNLHQTNPERDIWTSGNWLLSDEAIEQLVNGYLFLHETKADPAYFAAKILSYHWIVDSSFDNPNRVVFTVERIEPLSGRSWKGSDHGPAWTGYVVDE